MSALEDALMLQCRALKLPMPEREARFAPPRRWRADFLWESPKLLVEVHGGTWVQGRHTRGAGRRNDAMKSLAAQALGYFVMEFDGGQVKDGTAVEMIRRYLQGETNDQWWNA